MTPEEEREEFDYRYAERLGILCQGAEPTIEQIDLAFREADEAVNKLKEV